MRRALLFASLLGAGCDLASFDPQSLLLEPRVLALAEQVAAHLGFEPGPTTLAETMVQVYAHTGHHRGQVISRLRDLAARGESHISHAAVHGGGPRA